VEDAVSKGAKVHLGGKPHALGKTFYEPTLLSNINSSMICYGEEIFGPVAIVMRYSHLNFSCFEGMMMIRLD